MFSEHVGMKIEVTLHSSHLLCFFQIDKLCCPKSSTRFWCGNTRPDPPPPPPPSNIACGLSQTKKASDVMKIIGGKPVSSSYDYPWMVGTYIQTWSTGPKAAGQISMHIFKLLIIQLCEKTVKKLKIIN